MERQKENELIVSLTKAIEEWWAKQEFEMAAGLPYVGKDTFEIMATSAAMVLIGIADAQNYLYQEGMLKLD